MKAIHLPLVAALALSGFSALADEADSSQYALKFNSVRTAAEVKAEARNPVRITNGGTGFIGLTRSTTSSEAVKAEGATSARSGMTARGEFGPM